MDWASTSLAYARTYDDPIVWFDSPDDVVASTQLSGAEKLDILRRWQRQTLARAQDASLDERSALLSLRISRSIGRVHAQEGARVHRDRPSGIRARRPPNAGSSRRRGTAGE